MWLSVNWLLTEKRQKKRRRHEICRVFIGAKKPSVRRENATTSNKLWCFLKSEMCCLILRTENIASSWFFFFFLPHLNEREGGTFSLPKRSTLCVKYNEAKTCWGCSLTVLMHFNILWLSDRKKQQGRKKKKKPQRTLSVFSRWHIEGLLLLCAKMGRIAAVEIPFLWEDNLQLGNRPFYVPPSPVIGCHWSCVRGKRLHGSFPDFPGDFFPHCTLSLWRSNWHATVGFLKIAFVS